MPCASGKSRSRLRMGAGAFALTGALLTACAQVLGLDDIDYEGGDGGSLVTPAPDATAQSDAPGTASSDASTTDQSTPGDAGDAALPRPVTIASSPTVAGAVRGIATDAARVYWGTAGGYVMSALKDGGGLTTIATGQSEPLDVVILGTNLYWSVVPPGAGPQCMAEVASTAAGGADASLTCICTAAVTTVRMTLGASSVAFLAQGTGASVNNEYVGFPSAGSFTNVETQGPSAAIAATSSQGFLGNANGFHIDELAFPALAYGPAECTSNCGGTTIEDMTTDVAVQNILWITQGGGVHTVPIHVNGAVGTQLVVLPSTPQRLARDATYIYVTTEGQWVFAVPIGQGPDGGVALTLSNEETSPFGIAVDSSGVYWGNEDGTIRTTRPPP